jgi:ferredoxin
MKIRIDTGACTGHGRCYSLAPALFACDDDGYGQLLLEDVPADLEGEARKAALACPERAVVLEA